MGAGSAKLGEEKVRYFCMSDVRTNDNDVVASKAYEKGNSDYIALNSLLNFYDDDGKIQFDKDKEAVRQYFLNHVNSNMQWFHSLEEKLDFLIENEYYEKEFLDQYSREFVKDLFKQAYAVKFRFPTFVGAYKFYNQYAMKTFDGKRYLERYEDRISVVALYLARGDEALATKMMLDMVEGRYQPATPTFLNSGKKQRGDLVSCFPAGTQITVANGLTKNIEDLKVGEEVLTHTGELRPITKTIINPNSEHMITLKPANAPAVTMTGNHPVLIWTDDADDRETIITSELPEGEGYKWVAARDVRVNSDHVVFVGQNITTDVTELRVEDFIDLLPVRNGKNSIDKENYVVHEGYVKYALRDKKFSRREGREFSTRTAPVKNTVALDYDFGKFIGYYLSEGYASSRHKDGVHNSIVFTFGSKEHDFIQDVVDLTQRIFGLTAKVNYNNADNSAKISINSVLVAEMVHSLVGTGYNKKALSETLFRAGEEFTRGLLVGAFRGDGCTFESRIIMDLVNPELIRQLRTLSLSFGLVPGIRDFYNASENATSSLYFNATSPANQDLIYEVGKNLHRFVEPKSPRKAYTFALNDGNVVSLVVGKDESEAEDTVYNLEVEQDHTYLAEGTVVHNCFLIDIQDNMESISRAHNAALQLSKRGGGVALQLSNLRNEGAPIKKIENQSSGVVPVMKMLEDAFSYANQLGQRQGSGAVYLHAHHPDIMKFLDTRRENADEKIRIKTLSLGIVVPDVTFKLAAEGKDMYLFSPYDVERVYGKPFTQVSINEEYDRLVANPEISKKKLNARKFFQTVAEVQFESGYPYILFEDNANRANPIDGRITMSNLCSEILQTNTPSIYNDDLSYSHIGKDISCNLGSLNIAKVMETGSFAETIENSMRSLSAVSDLTDLETVPSIRRGNNEMHSVGLGAMNLHGYLAKERIHYGSKEGLDFTNMFFYCVNFYSLQASSKIAEEKGERFAGFEKSDYANGVYFEKYTAKEWAPKTEKVVGLFEKYGIHIPTQEDWRNLQAQVEEHGVYSAWRMAVAPTGSISYVSSSTQSILPQSGGIVEARKEGKMGRVYYPAPYATNDNIEYYSNAYELGYKKIIDTYAVATQHIDQGASCTLHLNADEASTRTLNQAQIYAWKRGLKTLYYVRVSTGSLEGTDMEGCVSCSI